MSAGLMSGGSIMKLSEYNMSESESSLWTVKLKHSSIGEHDKSELKKLYYDRPVCDYSTT